MIKQAFQSRFFFEKGPTIVAFIKKIKNYILKGERIEDERIQL